MNDYTVETLARKDILLAYPLVHLTMPQLDLKSWKRHALAAIGRGHNRPEGILIARSTRRHYICGMLSYRTISDFSLCKTLEVTDVFALDILNPRKIILTLLQALSPLAKRRHCPNIRIIVVDSAPLSEDFPAVLHEAEPDSVFHHALIFSFNA
jgi:hypothetical protein